jgi:hypothetical protein
MQRNVLIERAPSLFCGYPSLAARTSIAVRLICRQFGDDMVDALGRYPEQSQVGLAEFENEINGARHRRGAQRLINDSPAR